MLKTILQRTSAYNKQFLFVLFLLESDSDILVKLKLLHLTDPQYHTYCISLAVYTLTRSQEPICHSPNIYRPQRSWGKVIFSQASVILLTGGEVCLSACWDTNPPPPPRADTPRADTPLRSRPPLQSMLGDTGNVRVVHILLECNLAV